MYGHNTGQSVSSQYTKYYCTCDITLITFFTYCKGSEGISASENGPKRGNKKMLLPKQNLCLVTSLLTHV